jgi:hypothetical protein
VGRAIPGLAAFAAGVLMQQAFAFRAPGGRGALVALVAVVGVATGVSSLAPRLRRFAWLVAAAGVPPAFAVTYYQFQLIPLRYPGLTLVVVMGSAGLVLAGVLLALRDPDRSVRVAIGAGFAAGMAVGPLVVGDVGRCDAVLAVVLVGAFLVQRRSTVDVQREVPWLTVGVGVVLIGVQYWLLQAHVLPGGDDYPYRTGPGAMLIWAWSYGLGIAVILTLAALAYRQAGPAGARWAVALAALAFPAVARFSPSYGHPSWWFQVVAGLAGAVLGILLTARSRPSEVEAPWDAVGLIGLATLVSLYGHDSPAWVSLVGAGLVGLVLSTALIPLVRRTGVALAAVGTGFALWVYAGRALGPITDVDIARPAMVAWPLVAATVLVALHLLPGLIRTRHVAR